MRVDAAVPEKFGAEALRLLAPLGIEAALAAVAQRENATVETRRQAELALTQARYEADLARRQYDAPVIPTLLISDRLGPIRRTEGFYPSRFADHPLPGAADGVDDGFVVVPQAV